MSERARAFRLDGLWFPHKLFVKRLDFGSSAWDCNCITFMMNCFRLDAQSTYRPFFHIKVISCFPFICHPSVDSCHNFFFILVVYSTITSDLTWGSEVIIMNGYTPMLSRVSVPAGRRQCTVAGRGQCCNTSWVTWWAEAALRGPELWGPLVQMSSLRQSRESDKDKKKNKTLSSYWHIHTDRPTQGLGLSSSVTSPTMSLKPPSTAAVMMPRNRATMLRMVADHSRW